MRKLCPILNVYQRLRTDAMQRLKYINSRGFEMEFLSNPFVF